MPVLLPFTAPPRVRLSTSRVRLSTSRVRLSASQVRLSASRVRLSASRVRLFASRARLSASRVETFKSGSARFGSYIVDATKNTDVGETDLAVIGSPDTAVDSDAVTASDQGTGFMTLVFGDGGNPDQQP